MELLITDPYIMAQRLQRLEAAVQRLEAKCRKLEAEAIADRISHTWSVPIVSTEQE